MECMQKAIALTKRYIEFDDEINNRGGRMAEQQGSSTKRFGITKLLPAPAGEGDGALFVIPDELWRYLEAHGWKADQEVEITALYDSILINPIIKQ